MSDGIMPRIRFPLKIAAIISVLCSVDSALNDRALCVVDTTAVVDNGWERTRETHTDKFGVIGWQRNRKRKYPL